MVLATSSKARRLLYVRYLGHLRQDELEGGQAELQVLLADLGPGFRLLVDLTGLDSVDVDCAPGFGTLMELMDRGGVSMVVRVIPDPQKDIGLSILTIFHYRNRPRMVTCAKMTEAVELLSL